MLACKGGAVLEVAEGQLHTYAFCSAATGGVQSGWGGGTQLTTTRRGNQLIMHNSRCRRTLYMMRGVMARPSRAGTTAALNQVTHGEGMLTPSSAASCGRSSIPIVDQSADFRTHIGMDMCAGHVRYSD